MHDHHDHDHDHDHGGRRFEGPPDVPIDPAQESLVRALRASFNVLRFILIALVIAYFASGAFRVNQGEQGLIVRFGKLRAPDGGTPVLQPGLHAAWPDPFDEKIRLPGKVNRLEIGSFLFNRRPEDVGKPLSDMTPITESLRPGIDGAMISGDRNLSHGLWRIDYRIDNGEQYIQNVGDTPEAIEPLLQRLAERAIVRTVASRRVEEITRTARAEIAAEVKKRLQDALSSSALNTGITIDNVIPDTIEPVAVRSAFLNVTAAQSDAQKEIDTANQFAAQTRNQAAGVTHTELLRAIEEYGAAQATNEDSKRLDALRAKVDAELERAGGAVAVTLREAQSRANELREAVRREFEEFSFWLTAYHRDPALTTIRLWVDMRRVVLGSKQNEMFFLPSTGPIDILTNRDAARALAAEAERYRQTQGGGPPPPR